MNTGASRRSEKWLLELTNLPTAAGREGRVIAWIERWVAARRSLRLERDKVGNLIVRQRGAKGAGAARGGSAPLFITAHMDHPAFVVVAVRGREVELEFRGGVHPPYFERARIVVHGATGVRRAVLTSYDPKATPYPTALARLSAAGAAVAAGDVARFATAGKVPRIAGGRLHTYACDDLTGVVAALAAMDVIRTTRGLGHVGLLFTRAEEVGFAGALAACEAKSVPRNARLICLENSRSFAESPIGGGPIVRVGDRASVFTPALTNAITALMTEHEKRSAGFRWQRKLMPGGTCEATAFSAYGYQATCLCLPLGNYHNMVDIDGVQAGKRPARIGAEQIALADFHGLVEMLVVCATGLDNSKAPSLRRRMDDLLESRRPILASDPG